MSSYNGHGHVEIENVIFSNISVTGCARPFEIVEGNDAAIKDILLENFRVECYGYFHLRSDFATSVSNVTLRNWCVTMVDGPKPLVPRDFERRGDVWFRAERISGLHLEDFEVRDPNGLLQAWKNGAFRLTDCRNSLFERVTVNNKSYE
jgi:hypothetical protein